MSKVERGQFSSLLRRYLGMTGVSDVVDELAPEISATFPLEVERPEWEWLKGAKLMSNRNTVSAGVGAVSSQRYRNPATSGVVAVFYAIRVGSPTLGSFFLTNSFLGVDLASTNGSCPRDTRNRTFGSAIIASNANASAGGVSFDSTLALASTSVQLLKGYPFVLTPGNELNVTTGVLNVEMEVSAHWLEKKLDELEQQ